ncbi:MAG: zinc ribbon domain-containing protein [Chloroflexi bacterium]|nr:zinc ribbon domain-containing protein [Chloroflexota bacterium]
MAVCANCGTEAAPESSFCQACGNALRTREVGWNYRISPKRIMVMSVLSWSLYLFYWMYISWKHYRDHTGEQVYPVWHALAVGLPIYGFFRAHAHARSFKELMTNAGVENTINPGSVVAGVIVFTILGATENTISAGEITRLVATGLLLMDILTVVIVVWILLHLQENINRYWYAVSNGVVQDARVGAGEVILAIVGGFLWLDTFATLLSPNYRGGLDLTATLTRCCIAG